MNLENKKKIAFAISLIIHGALLIMAFKTVVNGFANAPRATGSLIRVRIDSKELSKSGEARQKSNEEALISVPEVGPLVFNTTDRAVDLIAQRPSTAEPAAQEAPLVAEKSSVEVIKEEGPGPMPYSPAAQRNTKSRLIATDDVFKDLVVSSSEFSNRSSVKPMPAQYGVAAVQAGVGTLTGVAVSGDVGLQASQEQNLQVPFEPKTGLKDIKSFLGYQLLTYEDPSDHIKYFKLSIRVEEGPITLPAIPKEVVFLVDASNSITQARLDQFKKGLQECFNLLGFNDKFNVMVFKKTVVKFMEKSVERNPTNIGNASDFLKGFQTGSKTDVFDAVLKSIDLKDAMKPAYLLLLSDGQPTEGVINPQQIINQIAKVNHGRIPVFAFGGGSFVDEYLLDFLAFTNRGWAEFSPREYQVSKNIVAMYNHIKDPVLLNLRYYSSGLDEKEIYPKLLPDFFRGSQFVLYGRYTDEKSFFLQLVGDAQGDIKQYLITDDISKAPQGDQEIAKSWAFRKVYHLVGLLEFDKENPDLIKEIKELTKKFGLKTPFMKNDQK